MSFCMVHLNSGLESCTQIATCLQAQAHPVSGPSLRPRFTSVHLSPEDFIAAQNAYLPILSGGTPADRLSLETPQNAPSTQQQLLSTAHAHAGQCAAPPLADVPDWHGLQQHSGLQGSLAAHRPAGQPLLTAEWQSGPAFHEASAGSQFDARLASWQMPHSAQQPAAAPQPGPYPMSAGPHYGGVSSDYQAVPPDAQPQSAYKDLAPCTDHVMRAPQHLLPAMGGPYSGGISAHYVAGLGHHESHSLSSPASRTQPQAQWPSSLLDQVASRPGQIAVQGPLDAGSAGGLFAAHTSVQQSADLDRYSFNILCFALQHLRTGL